MIWFACKQCGKRHSRAENLSGTLVFCECGYGNRVPWSSTVAEPDPADTPAAVPVPSSWPHSETPIPFRDEDEPRPARRAAEPPPLPPYRPKPKKDYRRVNPKFCLNHDESPTEHTCSQCRLPFCSKCVVQLQGEVLCGPCKNFKVRGMQRPTRITPLAIVALVAALVAGPIGFCLTLMGVGTQAQSAGGVSLLFGIISLMPPVGALVLGLWALKEIETKPRTGGRALAMTGTVAGLIGVLWSVTVVLVLIVKLAQG